jgi:hypothetical protein
MATVVDQASDITATDAATVAQATAFDAFLNAGVSSYSLGDTAVNLASATDLVSRGATNIVATTPATVAQATAIDAFANSGSFNFSLSDTAANLAAAPASVANQAGNITATDAATVAQAATIDAFGNSGTFSYSLSDNSANLSAAAALINGASKIDVSDGVTVAVASGLAANTVYGLSDTAANLAAATFDFVHRPALINASDAVTVAQLDAIHAYTNPGVLALLALADSAANLKAAITALDPALADARSFTVAGAASVAQADAIHGYNAISAQAPYALSDTAANVVAAIGVNDPALSAAISFTETGTATAAQAAAIHGFNAVSSLSTYALADTGTALAAAAAATVHAASSVTPSTALLAADATTLLSELASPGIPFSYSLSDTAAALAAAPAATVHGATSVTISSVATVAQATTLHGEAPLAAYRIADAATTLATALSTGNPNLAAVEAANTIAVTDTGLRLSVNADQFTNLLAGHALLVPNDTITIDGLNVLAPLGTLHAFGGVPLTGLTLGGAQNGSYIVNLGTSGETSVTMEGTGHQQITKATGVLETFVEGASSTGGSTLANLELNDVLDLTNAAKGKLSGANLGAGSSVTKAGQWAFAGGQLTWWDDNPGHNHAETLTLQFHAGSTHTSMQLANNGHNFTVI